MWLWLVGGCLSLLSEVSPTDEKKSGNHTLLCKEGNVLLADANDKYRTLANINSDIRSLNVPADASRYGSHGNCRITFKTKDGNLCNSTSVQLGWADNPVKKEGSLLCSYTPCTHNLENILNVLETRLVYVNGSWTNEPHFRCLHNKLISAFYPNMRKIDHEIFSKNTGGKKNSGGQGLQKQRERRQLRLLSTHKQFESRIDAGVASLIFWTSSIFLMASSFYFSFSVWRGMVELGRRSSSE